MTGWTGVTSTRIAQAGILRKRMCHWQRTTTLAGMCQVLQKRKGRIWHCTWLRGSPSTGEISKVCLPRWGRATYRIFLLQTSYAYKPSGFYSCYIIHVYFVLAFIELHKSKNIKFCKVLFNTLRWKLQGLSFHGAVPNKTQKLTMWENKLDVLFQFLSILWTIFSIPINTQCEAHA